MSSAETPPGHRPSRSGRAAVASLDARGRSCCRAAVRDAHRRSPGGVALRLSRLRPPPAGLRPRSRSGAGPGVRVHRDPGRAGIEDGLAETELQTLDFVRCLARGMAAAATVPIIEFTISDTFAAPVGDVLFSSAQGPRRHRRAPPGLSGTVVRPLGHAGHGGATPPGGRAARGGPQWPGWSRPPLRNST